MSQPNEPNTPTDTAGQSQAVPNQPAMPSGEKNIGDPTRFLDELEKSASTTPGTVNKPTPDPVKPLEGAQRTNVVQNATTENDPYSEGVNLSRPEILDVPSAPLAETMARLSSLTAGEVTGKPGYLEWVRAIQNGITRSPYRAAADDIFARKGTKWVQRLPYGNTKIGESASAAAITEGQILTGNAAINAAQRHVGVGGNFTAVLPHSGFHVTLKPPLEESILELHRQINQIKVEVGKHTYGLLLGAESGLINELLVRFALTSMMRNSIKDADNLLSLMSIHDINILVWAYMCTIYPNGFNHRAACIADTATCQHVVQDIINVRRLFYKNDAFFTEEQRAHLSSTAAGSMTAAAVMEYRKKMAEKEARTIILNEGEPTEVSLDLCVPSALQYFESTHRWIDSIGDKVVESLGADSTYNDRNILINEHAASTQMRKFAHWVQRINIGGAIVDRDKSGPGDIEGVLDAWSSSVTMREEFSEKVEQYVKDTCQALIGIPDFKCPACKKYQISENEVHPLHRSIVGIDVGMTFFTVLVQRVALIRE